LIDEADGILGRRNENDHKHLRAMLSELLREWDGVSLERQRNPFVLLATNMPWDLDPAILRWARVRILLYIPTQDQRIGILNVLLREETLEQDFSIKTLAWLTRAFTGSDLKFLCVSAALRSIEEQNWDKDGKYPEKRTLCKPHFGLALQNIKPSVADRFLLKRLADFK
ncbi:P-loop containing nucleoside triphosphate hydrolase protein, partial [Cladorrhinum sp. PSN259]